MLAGFSVLNLFPLDPTLSWCFNLVHTITGADGLEDGHAPFMNVPWQAAHIIDTWRGENSIRICVCDGAALT